MQIIVIRFKVSIKLYFKKLQNISAFKYNSKEGFEKYLSDFTGENCSLMFYDSLDYNDSDFSNARLSIGRNDFEVNADVLNIS